MDQLVCRRQQAAGYRKGFVASPSRSVMGCPGPSPSSLSDTMLSVRSRIIQECHEEIIAIVDINTARTSLSRSAPRPLSVLPTPLTFLDSHPLLLTLLWPLLLLLPIRRLVLSTESVTPLIVPMLEVTPTAMLGPRGCKPRTAGTRQTSSPICVSVPREVARTVFGTGPTSTWSLGRIMPGRLGLCTCARCEEVQQWCNLQTVYMTTWDLTQCFAILNNVMFYETSWVVQL